MELKKYLEQVKLKKPLVHNITNYVTVNNCANILLACGASPIMSDDCDEAEEITSICGGLNINIGTLNRSTIYAMFLSGKKANALGHPIVLDPVGAGASKLRTETAEQLIKEINISVIRGNISEIKALALGSGKTKGVDADIADKITEENIEHTVSFAKEFSKKTGAIIAITGETDIVSDGDSTFLIKNGHSIMEAITGSGCMLSAMITAYVTANQDNKLYAVVAAVCAMGLCGEIAQKRMTEKDGNGSFCNYLLDAVYQLDGEMLSKGAVYEVK